MITILFTIVHVLVCLFLILVVLAQQGKGQDLASAFGGAGSQTAFGARGTATLLSKITAGAAAIFMITSLTLSYLRPAVSERTVVPDTAPASESSTPPPSEGSTTPQEPPPAGEEPEETEAPPPRAPESQPEPTTSVPPPEPQGALAHRRSQRTSIPCGSSASYL
ncbi:MAG: preprotein translocase subunit SecG [Vicinamibacteria bacterium]